MIITTRNEKIVDTASVYQCDAYDRYVKIWWSHGLLIGINCVHGIDPDYYENIIKDYSEIDLKMTLFVNGMIQGLNEVSLEKINEIISDYFKCVELVEDHKDIFNR